MAKKNTKSAKKANKNYPKLAKPPTGEHITSVLKEVRAFKPTKDFAAQAHVKSLKSYEAIWKKSVRTPEIFWKKQAQELLTWIKPFTKTLKWKEPHAQWFTGGTLNVSANCLDRHCEGAARNKAALIWEGEQGDTRVLTYQDLLREVSQGAHALKNLGVHPGDRVTIYMPLIPETMIAMLACTRIGAMHTVVFAGFSSEALADRNNDSGAKIVITADGGWRKGSVVPLKKNVDAALSTSPTVKSVLVVRRLGDAAGAVPMQSGRDFWWHDAVEGQPMHFEPFAAPSEHPLFLLYTSGSTGKPKGIIHTTAGYLLGAMLSTKYVFDLKPSDVFWCTADVGWITGHSYLVYGPLANGGTVMMYEGTPLFPDAGRIWNLIEKYRISILYTAPTAIRACMKAGDQWPEKYDLSSLRLLGTVGEPINPEAWIWYRDKIGGRRCPVVDTWWQTETGSIMISPLPGAIPQVPGSATKPFFGIDIDIVNKEGRSVGVDQGGLLVIKKPWPSMLRGIWGDEARYKQSYWSHVPGCYFTGDGARRDKSGNIWIMGRIDDVLNVSGHRLSTMEIESALVSHAAVAEAAVVGRPDDLKGEGIVCFVTLHLNTKPSEQVKTDLQAHVSKVIGALARPDEIRFTDSLPKTRSGKIMRRLLRDIAAGRTLNQDTSTLEDFSVLATLRQNDDA